MGLEDMSIIDYENSSITKTIILGAVETQKYSYYETILTDVTQAKTILSTVTHITKSFRSREQLQTVARRMVLLKTSVSYRKFGRGIHFKKKKGIQYNICGYMCVCVSVAVVQHRKQRSWL